MRKMIILLLGIVLMPLELFCMEQASPDAPLVRRKESDSDIEADAEKTADYDRRVASALTESVVYIDASDAPAVSEPDHSPACAAVGGIDNAVLPTGAADPHAIELDSVNQRREAALGLSFDDGTGGLDSRESKGKKIELIDRDDVFEQFKQLICADRDNGEKTAGIRLLVASRRSLLSINVQPEGNTAMHIAARMNHKDTLATLVDLNGQLGITDDEGYTPLMIAASRGYVGMTRLLLEYRLVGKALLKAASATGLSNKLRGAADVLDATAQWASSRAIQNTKNARRLAFLNGNSEVCATFEENGYSVRTVLTDEDIKLACTRLGALKMLEHKQRAVHDDTHNNDSIIPLPKISSSNQVS